MFKPSDTVLRECERVLKESAEYQRLLDKAKAAGDRALYDFMAAEAAELKRIRDIVALRLRRGGH